MVFTPNTSKIMYSIYKQLLIKDLKIKIGESNIFIYVKMPIVKTEIPLYS